jgi:hypothetical protein
MEVRDESTSSFQAPNDLSNSTTADSKPTTRSSNYCLVRVRLASRAVKATSSTTNPSFIFDRIDLLLELLEHELGFWLHRPQSSLPMSVVIVILQIRARLLVRYHLLGTGLQNRIERERAAATGESRVGG